MKPLRLTIENIKSFTERQTVDFTTLEKSRIFVICGVTGAGKTTVLDSIVLALYGNKSDGLKIDEYVNIKSEKGYIEFDFEVFVGGENKSYRVTRTFYRTKNRSSKAQLIDLDTQTVLCEGGDKVTAQVRELIGLNEENFTKVIVLQQGKYGEFLKATRKDRTELVGNLFKLEKYRDLYKRASAEKSEVQAEIDALDDYLDGKKELTAAAIAEKNKNLKATAKAEKELNKTIADLKKTADAFSRASVAYADYEKSLTSLKKAEETLKEKVGALTEFEKNSLQNGDDDAKSNVYIEKISQAKIKLGMIEGRKENVSRFIKLGIDLKDKREEYRKEREKFEKEKAEHDKLKDREKSAAEQIAKLRASAESCGIVIENNASSADIQQMIGSHRLMNAAAAIKLQLKDGEECPVCGGAVCEDRGAKIDENFEKCDKVLLELAKKAAEREETERQLSRFHLDKSSELLQNLEEAGRTLKEDYDKLSEQLDGLTDNDKYEKALSAAEKDVAAMQKEYDEFKKSVDERESNHKRLIAEKSSALGAYESCVRSADAVKCEKPDEKKMKECEQSLEEAETQRDTVRNEISVLKIGIEADEKELAVKRVKESAKRRLTARTDRLGQLMKMFKGDAFLQFISQEYIEDFCVDASEYLSRMSGGCYTLGYDGNDFFVMDFRAGNLERSVKTLSGGETFLASLSLAIAVSRSIAAKNTSGLKFDFLFLDEGFGTLHEDAIGVVERALRSLSKETLVGIVTHRNELSELIPNKLVIESATESQGSKIKVVG